ncbi:MAG: sodium:solute symporter [Chitinophagales bacterium]|nr:sodium:solute symporter [Chitinophagales bacterium]
MPESLSPQLVLICIGLYFLLLLSVSYITSRNSTNYSFFLGDKKSPWFVVAFGMIGASLSGVTFISVPGWVGSSQFSYMQMVLGYMVGYVIIAYVLMPIYYRLNLTSIYTFLHHRLGLFPYKTGAAFFLLSRTIGAAFRLFLIASVLQLLLFDHMGVPFMVNVLITILLIWVYTFKGGIKTIVWTDTLQTTFMLLSLFISIYILAGKLDLDFSGLISTIQSSDYSQVFFGGWQKANVFWKQFIGGALIAVTMTGLDQDMMQKNLSCRNIGDAQKNMITFSVILLVVNLIFLCLGALLFIYATTMNIAIPEKTDMLFPLIAANELPVFGGIIFILGLIAAAYSSADSALTSLTTSFCIDFLNFSSEEEKGKSNQSTRLIVHIVFSFVLFALIMLFNEINKENVIKELFRAATYTYGPLLGLFMFGIISKRKIRDGWLVPLICILAPTICYILYKNADKILNNYQMGFELLLFNGLLTFAGLYIISKKAIHEKT